MNQKVFETYLFRRGKFQSSPDTIQFRSTRVLDEIWESFDVDAETMDYARAQGDEEIWRYYWLLHNNGKIPNPWAIDDEGDAIKDNIDIASKHGLTFPTTLMTAMVTSPDDTVLVYLSRKSKLNPLHMAYILSRRQYDPSAKLIIEEVIDNQRKMGRTTSESEKAYKVASEMHGKLYHWLGGEKYGPNHHGLYEPYPRRHSH